MNPQPAQTIIQLYNELAGVGLSHAEQCLVRNAYDLAIRLFADRHCYDGRPYVCHLSGTASIVARRGGSAREIAAALLHSAYVNGNFGDHTATGGTPRRRWIVRGVTCEQTEQLVYNAFSSWDISSSDNKLLAAHREEHDADGKITASVSTAGTVDGEGTFRIVPRMFAEPRRHGELAEPLCGDLSVTYNGVPEPIGTSPQLPGNKCRYAQTLPQLIQQIKDRDYPAESTRLIERTYELAAEVFSGRFEQNGKVFLCHGVGVASIIASRGLDIAIVAAGLIHNIYRSGQFGGIRRGPFARRRRYVAERSSKECEEIVNGFFHFAFRSSEVNVRELGSLSSEIKKTFVILLADQCEKLIDGEVLYHADASTRLRSLRDRMPMLKQLAVGIDASDLYEELNSLCVCCESTSVPDGFRSRSQRRWSQIVVSASCSRRLSVTILDYVATRKRRLVSVTAGLIRRIRVTYD